jgi:hypothetical protein
MLRDKGGDKPYYYAVGQPMGALSSWAMLAITHHIIVQIAARRTGLTSWFSDYAVLGDDIVIADEAVARSYLTIMGDLGVEINLHKSLVSKIGYAEFAKRLISSSQEVTPVGPSTLSHASRDIRNYIMVLRDLVGKGIAVSHEFLEQLFSEQPDGLISRKKVKLFQSAAFEAIGPFGLVESQVLTPTVSRTAISSLSRDEILRIRKAVLSVIARWHLRDYLSAKETSRRHLKALLNVIRDPNTRLCD